MTLMLSSYLFQALTLMLRHLVNTNQLGRLLPINAGHKRIVVCHLDLRSSQITGRCIHIVVVRCDGLCPVLLPADGSVSQLGSCVIVEKGKMLWCLGERC